MKIVIEVRGGAVQEIYSDSKPEIYIVDWDNIIEGDSVVRYVPVKLSQMSEKTKNQVDNCRITIKPHVQTA